MAQVFYWKGKFAITRIVRVDDLITVGEAAGIRGVSRNAIWDLINRGKIRAERIFGRVLVYRTEIENYTPDKAGRPPKAAKKRKTK